MTDITRPSGRQPDQMRDVRIERRYTKHAEGSVLVSFGDTKVLCTASVEERVPGFLRGKGEGWVTAEYGMLPRSTNSRMGREAAQGKQGGRTLEIQRLIGRSLRACVDRNALGERTITLDCDVLQADGGGFIEVQGTAEGHAFRRGEMDAMLALAEKGIVELVAAQRAALAA